MSRVDSDSEFSSLLSGLIEGSLTPAQFERLGQILETDAVARAIYRKHVSMHAMLHWRWHQNIDSRSSALPPTIQTSPSPHLAFLGNTVHAVVGYLSSGWPVAYLIATVIFGVGLLIGSLMPVSHPEQIAQQSAPLPSHLSPLPSVVAKITGMSDCQWADRSAVAVNGAHVPLGRTYTLAAGLMEITYETGAKVVLQGPVTYQVESASGGYLAVGKLTARLAKGEGERRKAEESNPQSPIPNPSSLSTHHYPLFTIKTPTAIVTDLGTAFGVEVEKDGTCEVHVLKGLVQTKFFASGGQASQIVQLKEGEGRRYQREPGQVTVIAFDRAKFDEMRIVKPDHRRDRWLAYSRQLRQDPALVAYYTFEPAGGNTRVLPNLSPAGSVLDGQVEGAEWVYGRLPGKYALYFHGPGSGDKVMLPEQDRFNFTGPFSVAVWFKVSRFTGSHQGLVTKGNRSWRFQQSSERNELTFDTNYGPKSEHGTVGRIEVADNRWHLGVAAYEPAGQAARKRLYVDARLDAENETPLALNRTDRAVWLGANSGYPGLEFGGLIDEAAIFARALSAEEIQKMFEAGNPAGPRSGERTDNK